MSLSFLTDQVKASDYSFLRFNGLLGFGTSEVSVGSGAKSEGPQAISLGLDYLYSPRWLVGVQHSRTATVSPLGSKVGMTGLSFKYSLFVPHSQVLLSDAIVEKSFFQQKNWVIFLGTDVGMAQGSLFKTSSSPDDRDSSTVGLFVGGTLGVDYPFVDQWGLRSELKVGQTIISSGQISYVMFLFGAYVYL